MRQWHVVKNPNLELGPARLGGIAEVFIKANWLKAGFLPMKLCEHDSDKKKQILLIDNVKKVLKKSKLKKEERLELIEYLQNHIIGLPDFIVLAPDKEVLFIEAKYNGGEYKAHQRQRAKELEYLGYPVFLERTGKLMPASQTTLTETDKPEVKKKETKLQKLLNKILGRNKPKLITTHKIG